MFFAPPPLRGCLGDRVGASAMSGQHVLTMFGAALLPKFGAVISAFPIGVLGGAVTVLFGLIAVLGARIWIDARVDFRDPVTLATAGVALIVGACDYTLNWGEYSFAGIALGTVAAVVIYQVLRPLSAQQTTRE